MPYEKTLWVDEIVDPTNGEVLQEGTPYLAEYANNFEQGIYDAHEKNAQQDNELRRIWVTLEINGRVPTNSGTFYDLLDGSSSRINRDDTSATFLNAVSAGATDITVDDATGFEDVTQVTIYDDVNSEEVLVSGVSGNTITVQALTNAYKKGAKISRSNVVVADDRMSFGEWGTFTISEVTE